jgi:hypothetical protein
MGATTHTTPDDLRPHSRYMAVCKTSDSALDKRVIIAMESLERNVAALGLGAPATHTSSQTFTNPLDLFRSYLAEILVDIADCSDSDARKAIQWPNNVFNGDLAVVLPRLKPGVKADKLAVDIMEKVLPHARCCFVGAS